jgi:cysteine desulfurase/selenocysteine lyase
MNREDFPILGREVYGRPLVYLDNAATTQKPRCVVEAISEEYYNVNANVHRGVHFLSQQATELHEASRETVRNFINARSTSEIIFTRGTTESINLLAFSFGEAFCHEGDEIIVTEMEHHSNIVPWQMLCQRRGMKLRVVPMLDDYTLDLATYRSLLNERTRLVCVTHVSNVLGTVNPVREIIAEAHAHDIPVLVDGAQSAPHIAVDVQQLDCDFFAFSGHKIYGPTGVGVLYGRERLLDQLPPYQGGGEMIRNVSFERTTYNDLPYRFEAGTPDYVGTHALAVALDYVTALGMDHIHAYESQLASYAYEQLSQIENLVIYGGGNSSLSVGMAGSAISFNIRGIHHLDLGTLLDRLGIAVRTGHHCAEPLMRRLGIEGTVRASFALYNTRDEVDALVAGIRRVVRMF